MQYVNKKVKKRFWLQKFEEKNLVVVLDFVAVANLKFPIIRFLSHFKYSQIVLYQHLKLRLCLEFMNADKAFLHVF